MPSAAPAAPAAPGPGQQRAWPGALGQLGSPPAPGSPGLIELSGIQPSFAAILGRYLGRVIGGYLFSAVLLGVLAVLLEVVRYRFGVTLPAAVMPGQWARPVAGLLALSGVVHAVVAYLRTASTRLSLHPGRLDTERGLLRRQTTMIDLRQLRRVTLSQTALQRLTGDGTLLLELAGGAGPTPVTGLARGPQLHQIYQQMAALASANHR
jgi:membrane protein YdbS with pleckstrin-like domain